jgi:hypothetical protein
MINQKLVLSGDAATGQEYRLTQQVITLSPDEAQTTKLKQFVGAMRFAHNWALGNWMSICKGEAFDAALVLKRLLEVKDTNYQWIDEVSEACITSPIVGLEVAFRGYDEGAEWYPSHYKKGRDDWFSLEPPNFKVGNGHIYVDKIGNIKFDEPFLGKGDPVFCTVVSEFGEWFAIVICGKLPEYLKISTKNMLAERMEKIK